MCFKSSEFSWCKLRKSRLHTSHSHLKYVLLPRVISRPCCLSLPHSFHDHEKFLRRLLRANKWRLGSFSSGSPRRRWISSAWSFSGGSPRRRWISSAWSFSGGSPRRRSAWRLEQQQPIPCTGRPSKA